MRALSDGDHTATWMQTEGSSRKPHASNTCYRVWSQGKGGQREGRRQRTVSGHRGVCLSKVSIPESVQLNFAKTLFSKESLNFPFFKSYVLF